MDEVLVVVGSIKVHVSGGILASVTDMSGPAECLEIRNEMQTRLVSIQDSLPLLNAKPPPVFRSICGPLASLQSYMSEFTAGCCHQNGLQVQQEAGKGRTLVYR